MPIQAHLWPIQGVFVFQVKNSGVHRLFLVLHIGKDNIYVRDTMTEG